MADPQTERKDPAASVRLQVDELSVRNQLSRIESSEDFDIPQRGRRFLAYVVAETLAGRADRIKAYSIAIEVFGRDSSFDPQGDPVVRIEAGRVRRALERYYLTSGGADPILITIPKGGYVPLFRPSGAPTTSPSSVDPAPDPRQKWLSLGRVGLVAAALCLAAIPAAWVARSKPAAALVTEGLPFTGATRVLLLEPFEDLTGTQSSIIFARELTIEIIGQIAEVKDLIVIDGAHLTTLESPAGDRGHSAHARYVLGAGVRMADGAIRVTAMLRNSDDGSIIWAENFDTSPKSEGLLALQTEIAPQVVALPGRVWRPRPGTPGSH